MESLRYSLVGAAACLLVGCGGQSHDAAQEAPATRKPVTFYAFPDEVGERALPEFERRYHARVVLDPIPDNLTLETKLLAGKSGYDVVMPTNNFLAPLIASGALRKLDRQKLTHWPELDPQLLAQLNASDPGNQYAVPYVWGTVGVGLNTKLAERALGYPPPYSVRLLFDPQIARRLSSCGVAWPDAGGWIMTAWASLALGRDPSTQRVEDLPAIEGALMQVRPFVKYIDSLRVDSDLPNGEICVGVGPSGGLLQAREAGTTTRGGSTFEYVLPVEGALLWIDALVVPADAPDVEGAHRLIDHLIDASVIAEVTNTSKVANANRSATALVQQSIRTNPSIYPQDEVMRRLHLVAPETAEFARERTKMWTRVRDRAKE